MNENKALNKAARDGNTSKLEELLNENPLLLDKVKPLFIETPLHIAALAGHAEFVKLLVQRAPNLARQTDHEGLTALHVAAARGHSNIVSMLLEFDHELALIGDIQESTPLHYAAYYGEVHVARLLLSKMPMLLKHVNSDDQTALDVALKNKQYDMMKVFGKMVENKEVELDGHVLMHSQDEYGHSIQLLIDSISEESEVLQPYTKDLNQSRHVEGGNKHLMNSEVETIAYQLDKMNFASEAMLVIGMLIATLTCQALMRPPQSMLKDGVVNEKRIKYYIFFLACNSASFFASCIGIFSGLRKNTSMLGFWVSSSLTLAAASYICILVSIMEKVFPEVIIASLIIVIPNMITSLFLYSSKVRMVVRKILQSRARF